MPGALFLERTEAYWRSWVRALEVSGEWRDAVVRAAITLELNVYEETGAIIAAMTTSIPEAPNTERTWDYRFCWPRDACFALNALSRVGEIGRPSVISLFSWAAPNQRMMRAWRRCTQSMGILFPHERTAECLAGYRGMGPVRIGNKASEQQQNDIYGEAVLTAEPLFEDSSARWVGDEALFARLERFGQHAVKLYQLPDAGLWELRGGERVHILGPDVLGGVRPAVEIRR